uniref:GPI transamidase component PIG-T n=1 Tax=Kalanchoe fedtschenkoi TaxID=63787 RepID=A0A7N0ZYF5_KALFE
MAGTPCYCTLQPMEIRRSSGLPLFLLLLLISTPLLFGSAIQFEAFSEELLLKPLPDRRVLAHFHFETKVPPTPTYGKHHRLFPKAIYQLVRKYRVREMELSFMQGRWNYERWGGSDPISSNNAKPPGVELWAVFDVPEDQVDATWKNLTHTLSGLFCASINFLESSTAYASPGWSFRQFSGPLRYGSLPREAVCTENLTPWLKLLPCRDKAGLATLMDRPSIYSGFYHSQRLHLTSTEFNSAGVEEGIILQQTLTVVLKPDAHKSGAAYVYERSMQPSWSLSSVFGREVHGKCVVADSSSIYLQLDGDLLAELNSLREEHGNSGRDNVYGFRLSADPDSVIHEASSSQSNNQFVLFKYLMDRYSDSEPFDLELTWTRPVYWSSSQAPLQSSRFLMGSGNERGAIAISLKSPKSKHGLSDGLSDEDSCKLKVHVFQLVPWYVKVYYHTLQVFVDGDRRSVADVIEKITVSPSEDKVSPGMMELALQLPCRAKSTILTIEFDKGFLHINEYPPDANQGFDIPSAIISFPGFQTSMQFSSDNHSFNSPLLAKLKENSSVSSYTEVLLVPLTTPDFSMPYNVITITCTVFALYFGSLLNALRRRVGEEERLLKSKAADNTGLIPKLLAKLSAKISGRQLDKSRTVPPTSSSSSSSYKKLIFKVVLVAGIAAAWQYYFN